MDARRGPDGSLPVRRGLRWPYALSLLTAALMAVASVAGLAYRAALYPTDALLRAFLPNDVVNVVVGLPVLLASVGLAARGRLVGLLCWPGGLLFALYNYIAYAVGLPPTAATPLHLAVVAASAVSLAGLVLAIDGGRVREALAGVAHARATAAILAALGTLFLLRAVGVIAQALAAGAVVPSELAASVSDLVVAPAWVVGGISLWRRTELGYAMGLGLLLGISLLFVALVLFLLVQPLLTAAPFAPVDVTVIAVMGLVCFVPLGLFVRAAATGRRPSSA